MKRIVFFILIVGLMVATVSAWLYNLMDQKETEMKRSQTEKARKIKLENHKESKINGNQETENIHLQGEPKP